MLRLSHLLDLSCGGRSDGDGGGCRAGCRDKDVERTPIGASCSVAAVKVQPGSASARHRNKKYRQHAPQPPNRPSEPEVSAGRSDACETLRCLSSYLQPSTSALIPPPYLARIPRAHSRLMLPASSRSS